MLGYTFAVSIDLASDEGSKSKREKRIGELEPVFDENEMPGTFPFDTPRPSTQKRMLTPRHMPLRIVSLVPNRVALGHNRLDFVEGELERRSPCSMLLNGLLWRAGHSDRSRRTVA
jgi:hypothetical protein